MTGTNSALDVDLNVRGARTAGVGYGYGERYAKWGRFACEMPVCSPSHRACPGGGATLAQPCLRVVPSRRRPRSSTGTENTGRMRRRVPFVDGVGGGDEGGTPPQTGDAPRQPKSGEAGESKSAHVPTTLRSSSTPGAPAYLQVGYVTLCGKSGALSICFKL